MRGVVVVLPGALALAIAVATADGVELPWLLLGTRLEADATARVFLLVAAVAWTTAALAIGPTLRGGGVRPRRLAVFAAVALIGNLGVAVAQDAISFYTCFSAMSLSAYGLVAARGDGAATRAGRVYIAMAVAAEAALLAGFALAVRTTGGTDLADIRAALADAPDRDAIIGLLVVGFGVKAGALGLHLWLPLAYTAAPLPLAAVLAGSLTEVGVLGWLRALPAGDAALDGWGAALVAVGLAAVAYALVVGVTQTAGAAVLAYSSIGQIGLMAAGIGVAMARPDLAPAAIAAVLVLALHHGVVKGSLFLALGVARAARPGGPRIAARVALVALALALAGAPLTSGGVAKESLKTPGESFWGGMGGALALSAAATATLMWRLLTLAWRPRQSDERLPGAGAAAGLALGVAAAVAVPLLAGRWSALDGAATGAPSVGTAWAGLWPIGAGIALALVLGRAASLPGARVRVPTGDMVVPAERAGGRADAVIRAVTRAAARAGHRIGRRTATIDPAPLWRALTRAEAGAATLATGAIALAVVVMLVAAVLR